MIPVTVFNAQHFSATHILHVSDTARKNEKQLSITSETFGFSDPNVSHQNSVA